MCCCKSTSSVEFSDPREGKSILFGLLVVFVEENESADFNALPAWCIGWGVRILKGRVRSELGNSIFGIPAKYHLISTAQQCDIERRRHTT